MTELIILVLGVSVLLYVLLGGADFGAGMVELFTGRKSILTISKAIAPVWEANHIWIILAIVILFNGFPRVYTTITTYLHIPLLFLLIGITVRGTAFTFRYYDIKDQTQWYYTALFRISSIVTPLFLGVVLGAVMMGRIYTNPEAGFYELFIYPWLNFFTFLTGIFVCLLFAWLAATYLIGETKDEEENRVFTQINILLFISLFVTGAGIFIIAEYYEIFLFNKFSQSPIGLISVAMATFLIPLFWYGVKIKNALISRITAGAITTFVFLGWFAVQFPVMVYLKNGLHLTINNTKAPDATLYFLIYALGIGIFIILPAFAYLFNVFKFKKDTSVLNE